MCTVTWTHTEDGYDLFCNRDEKLSRAPACPPEVTLRDGVRVTAPVDGDAGGAWIASNEFGVTLCLLNGNGPGRGGRSRGLVLLDLAPAASKRDVYERFSEMNLLGIAPFRLAVLELDTGSGICEWDGREKAILPWADRLLPLVSSSFDAGGVQASRTTAFHSRVACGDLSPGTLAEFHRGHDPAPGPYSPCMHRPDAATVSFSAVHVSGRGTEFRYHGGAPCRRPPAHVVILPLRM